MNYDTYDHPLVSRYADPVLSRVWSPSYKFSTWRRLWVVLARGEMELGIQDITEDMIECMEQNIEHIDYAYAEEKEKELRHDVMAHVHAFGKAVPCAMKIIHLGATSCYITDNTELVQIKESLKIVKVKLLKLMKRLAEVADLYKDLPTLAFTHFQPAQLTTVGKRFCLWLQDFWYDFQQLEHLIEWLPFRGVKGTTGTQASFLELFEGDHEKIKALDRKVTQNMGFQNSIPVSGQTYSRKVDYQVIATLSGLAQSAHKMATDVRLLQHLKEIEEPFGLKQIGSSAMAYKRNPMRSERVCSIARHVMALVADAQHTHANQWFERTLDDSANRRMSLPEAFLGTDACLSILENVVDGIQVWPQVIRKHILAELPFMATEVILMACVKAGGDRQELHEAIREHSMEAGRRVKVDGADNDLISRIAADKLFAPVHSILNQLTDPSKFTGRAKEQVTEFLDEHIIPILKANEALVDSAVNPELKV